jgi:hypothetical protein
MFSNPFWMDIEIIFNDLGLLYLVFHLSGREGCTICLVYEFMNRPSQTLKSCENLSSTKVIEVTSRWTSCQEWLQTTHPFHIFYREPKMEWLAMIFMAHGPHTYPMFLDVIDQNALEDEFFKFFCKEDSFAKRLLCYENQCYKMFHVGRNLVKLYGHVITYCLANVVTRL